MFIAAHLGLASKAPRLARRHALPLHHALLFPIALFFALMSACG